MYMAKEIERKFLVLDQTYKQHAKGVYYQQGYLSSRPSVRVRIIDKEAFLTIKGVATGFSRSEYEYQIPYKDGIESFRSSAKDRSLKSTGIRWSTPASSGRLTNF